MERQKAKTRRRGLLFDRISFFFKALLACVAFVAALAGYMRFRVEKVALAYEISENVRAENLLIDEVAAAELRYNRVFSSRKLSEAAKQRGFREPRHSDFIYESEPGGVGGLK